jgi:hypothetical protein
MTQMNQTTSASAVAPAKPGQTVNYPRVDHPTPDVNAKEKSGGRSTHDYRLTSTLPGYLAPVL